MLIAAFSVAFGLVAPWQHVRHDPSHTALEPCVLLIMQRTWATTQFVPFLYLALRLYGRTVLASHAAIAWGLWVHGVEVALAAFSPLDDLVENYRSASACCRIPTSQMESSIAISRPSPSLPACEPPH